jgi:phosphatidylserine/phosphatidylglycerophosphate/cardiolipin synthase-like enzyme
VGGNAVRILRNGKENYPEWEAAIKSAQKTIHIEMYIIHNDRTGSHFRDLLVSKARAGVTVRVLYDWFGSISILGRGMWRALVDAGGDVRAVNPPGFGSLLGWASRDHRKLLTVDRSVAFISGLCVGDAWVGDGTKKGAPWRDTGVVIRGPAVAYAEEAFAAAWQFAGPPVPARERSPVGEIAHEGDVNLRIVAASPDVAGLYRFDLLAASVAKDYFWLTDAYFLGTSPYIQALRSAAMDGIDVRLLVPRGSDIQWIANISRTMYRSLLEAGVRVFEWNGPMMHAKTAVCDDRMIRIGSTNLNIASWIGNWELDVVIEDTGLAKDMKEMFMEDFRKSTEIVITGLNKVRPARYLTPTGRLIPVSSGGKSVIAGVVKVGSALNNAVTGRRGLGRTESASLLSIGWFLFIFAIAGILFPKFIAYPLGVILGWAGFFFIVKSLQLRFGKTRHKGKQKTNGQ